MAKQMCQRYLALIEVNHLVQSTLHNLFLDGVKYFVTHWLFVRGKWYISNKIKDLDDFMLHAIKVTDFVNRVPQALTALSF